MKILEIFKRQKPLPPPRQLETVKKEEGGGVSYFTALYQKVHKVREHEKMVISIHGKLPSDTTLRWNRESFEVGFLCRGNEEVFVEIKKLAKELGV